jgi:molybdate transport system substrate-binding protein
MDRPIRVISSMATRHVLNELAELFQRRHPYHLVVESVGGVVAAGRVRAGEPFDVVVLAADAIDSLTSEGWILAAGRVDVVHSDMAAAVRKGAPRPDISNEALLRDAVMAARRIGYSSGPSGTRLEQLLERWGVAAEMRSRVVSAPPGVPVSTLIADGRVELGFQQLSELIHEAGIDIVGPLPTETRAVTVFSAAPTSDTSHPSGIDAWLAFLTTAETDEVKWRHGTRPAR